jgi:hypothetical protein
MRGTPLTKAVVEAGVSVASVGRSLLNAGVGRKIAGGIQPPGRHHTPVHATYGPLPCHPHKTRAAQLARG